MAFIYMWLHIEVYKKIFKGTSLQSLDIFISMVVFSLSFHQKCQHMRLPYLPQNSASLFLIVTQTFQVQHSGNKFIIYPPNTVPNDSSCDMSYIDYWYHLLPLLSQDVRMVWNSHSVSHHTYLCICIYT